MPTASIEQLLNAVMQLPPPEYEQFLQKLLHLKAREKAPCLSKRESELLLAINQGLPPADARRMRTLIRKRQAYEITPDELQELIGLTNESERLGAERLKHLIELAALRNVTLDEIMQQLGIGPRPI